MKDEVSVLMANRSATLLSTYKFFQFKSELSFLDAWIQSQIGHISTDGIGTTTGECDQLVRETESFARNLMSKEDRVEEFGVLSQELMELHPGSAKVHVDVLQIVPYV